MMIEFVADIKSAAFANYYSRRKMQNDPNVVEQPRWTWFKHWIKPKISKFMAIVKRHHKTKAKQIFEGTSIQISTCGESNSV